MRSEYLGHWNNERYFLVMDYIEGEPMRELINKGVRPDNEEFRTVALCLLEAVAAYHNYEDEDGNSMPLLHCDIKPVNIIMTKDNKPVLIVCTLSGEPRIDAYQGTRDYIPPDAVLGSDVQLSKSSDLYGLGVTLWEWLFGQKPYERASIGDEPSLPSRFNELPENLKEWFLKAVATDSDHRFKDVEEMREMITAKRVKEEEKPELPELPEPADIPVSEEFFGQDDYVAYLNTLSNNSAGNENATAEHQVLSSYFQRIYVDNPIADTIFKQLIEERKNVILTGNAGDGKTTIAINIFRRVSREYRFLKSIERVNNANLVIVKDMSELSREQQEEILTEARDNEDVVYLIVTNTGTLLESIKRVYHSEQVESDLLGALKADTPQSMFDDRFLVINLGRIDSIKTACDVLRKMVAESNWMLCTDCEHPDLCPLHLNVKLILEREDIFFERLELLYRRLFEYGTRLTMRHMTGHLAYALTGGLYCNQVRKRSLISLDGNLGKELFIDRFFGDDGSEVLAQAQQLFAVRKIR